MKVPFKNRKLAVAMTVALGASAASSPAMAVNHSDNGLGDVGLISYYSARNALQTQLSITNTSDVYVVAVKIRFREADNTRDARDFNIFLSPNDVWTGGVTMSDDGETPVLRTFDNSCTAPALIPIEGGGGEVPFTNSDYINESNDNNLGSDGGATTIERTQDGHIEIFAMGVDEPRGPVGDIEANLAWSAVHVDGTPRNCARIRADYSNNGGNRLALEFNEPLNVIKVLANLIQVDAGVAGGLPVDTLANFYNPGCIVGDLDIPPGTEIQAFPCPSPDNLMFIPASRFPDLSFAQPSDAQQITEMGAINDFFAPGTADAVSSLFMATSVINDYAIGGASFARNDWVITFPTKNFYVDLEDLNTGQEFPPAPFFEFFQPPRDVNGDFTGNGQSCVPVVFDYYNREEFGPEEENDLPFSPRPPGAPGNSICQETQALVFASDSVLGARNEYGVPLSAGWTSGWMRLTFQNPDEMPGALTLFGFLNTYFGLPVTGFGLKSLENGVSSDLGVLNYGVVQEHSYDRLIVPNEF